MSAPLHVPDEWFDSPKWSVAHRMHDRPTEEFLGATYWTTLCGKRVNASRTTRVVPTVGAQCSTCRSR